MTWITMPDAIEEWEANTKIIGPTYLALCEACDYQSMRPTEFDAKQAAEDHWRIDHYHGADA